jgi:hypothetical protein
MKTVAVDETELRAVRLTLDMVEEFIRRRDEMNALIHLAAEVRYSPLTLEVIHARELVEEWLATT